AGRHANYHADRGDRGDSRGPERDSGRAADMTIGIAVQGSRRSESEMHDEPLVGRRGEALGGDPGLPADVVHWLRQSARMWTRGKAPRCVGATITSLGAIGY